MYSLNLIDDAFTPASDLVFYHHYQIVNIANTERRIEGLEFVFVELPKYSPKTLTEKTISYAVVRPRGGVEREGR